MSIDPTFLKILTIKEASETVDAYDRSRLYKRMDRASGSRNSTSDCANMDSGSVNDDDNGSVQLTTVRPMIHRPGGIKPGLLNGGSESNHSSSNGYNSTTDSGDYLDKIEDSPRGAVGAAAVEDDEDKLLTTHNSDYYRCPFCVFKHLNKMTMRRHLLVHYSRLDSSDPPAPINAIAAPTMPVSMKTELKAPVTNGTSNTGNVMYRCSTCPFKSIWQYAVKRHMLKVHIKQGTMGVLKLQKTQINNETVISIVNNTSDAAAASNGDMGAGEEETGAQEENQQVESNGVDHHDQDPDDHHDDHDDDDDGGNGEGNGDGHGEQENGDENGDGYLMNDDDQYDENGEGGDGYGNEDGDYDYDMDNENENYDHHQQQQSGSEMDAKLEHVNSDPAMILMNGLHKMTQYHKAIMNGYGAGGGHHRHSLNPNIINNGHHPVIQYPMSGKNMSAMRIKLEHGNGDQNENKYNNPFSGALPSESTPLPCGRCLEKVILTDYLGNKFTATYIVENGSSMNSPTPTIDPLTGQLVHKKKMYFCQSCPYKTNNYCNLKQHLVQHKFNPGYFKCRFCDYYVSMVRLLKQHEVLHPKYMPRDNLNSTMFDTVAPHALPNPMIVANLAQQRDLNVTM